MPVSRKRFHYDWHWFWEYGNGDLGNSDVHRQDLCCWALNRTHPANSVISFGGRLGYQDAGETPNTQISLYDLNGVTHVSEVRGLISQKFPLPGNAVVYGTEGIVILESGRSALCDLDGSLQRSFVDVEVPFIEPTTLHVANFIQAVKDGQPDKLHADASSANVSASMCHLANCSYRLGVPVTVPELRERLGSLSLHEDVTNLLDRTSDHLADNGVEVDDSTLRAGATLEFDPAKEVFTGRSDANALLAKPYRAPFVLPSAANV